MLNPSSLSEVILSLCKKSLRCGFWNGSSISQISSPIVLNQWHMVTMTYDGTSLKGYLNGNLFGTTSFVRQAPAFMPTAQAYIKAA